jgi:hypothetical protein
MPFDELLTRSRASHEVKVGLRTLASTPFGAVHEADWLTTARPAPAVKVVRLLTQLLHAEPELAVERVHVDAWSGCSDFSGTVTVTVGREQRHFDFTWDCRWRAIEEGYVDWFGQPDQIRAAREFDWQCFARWTERSAAAARTTAVV